MPKQENPLACPKCGSTHFQEAEFKQYHQGTYSASPGGEPYPVIEHGPGVRVCLCGHPLPMVTRAVEQKYRESFAASLEKALVYRTKLDPDWLLTTMQQVYASKQDASDLNHQLAQLLEIVRGPDYQDSGSAANPKSKQKIAALGERKSDGEHTLSQPKRRKS